MKKWLRKNLTIYSCKKKLFLFFVQVYKIKSLIVYPLFKFKKMTDIVESYLQIWRDKLVTNHNNKELTPAEICSLFRQEVWNLINKLTKKILITYKTILWKFRILGVWLSPPLPLSSRYTHISHRYTWEMWAERER